MVKNVKAVALTTERHATHGPFSEVARVTSALVDVIKTGVSYPALNETQKMSLKEAFHKVARIVSGDPNHVDHWDDVGGYAHLGAKACVALPEAPTLRKVRRKVKNPKARKPAKKKVKARPVVRGSRKRPAKRVAKAARVRRPRAVAPESPVRAAEAA